MEPIQIPSPENFSNSPTSSSCKSNINGAECYLLLLYCIIKKNWIPIKLFSNLSDISKYLYDEFNLKYSASKLNFLCNDRQVKIKIVLDL